MRVITSVLATWLLLFSALVQGAAPRDPYEHFFQQSLGDFREELEIAKEEGKQYILLFFEDDDCPFCHVMKNTVLNQPEVQEYFRKHFKLFVIDVDGDVEITDFDGKQTTMKLFAEKKNRVRATPVFAFFDLEGKRVVRVIGKTTGVEEFMQLGQFVAEGAYKKMNFTKYKASLRKAE